MNRKTSTYMDDRMVLLGFSLAAIYWILDSFLHMLLSPDMGLWTQILGGDPETIWPRAIVSCLFAIFGSHAQYTINERRRAQEALKKSEERYRSIIESIEDGYFEADLKGRFTFFNQALCRILQYAPGEMTGFMYHQGMDEESISNVSSILDQVHRTGKPAKAVDWTINTKSGSRRFVEATISLIRNQEHSPTGYRGIIRDVTERRRAEALRQAKAAAEAASKSKSEFLANMSHEIRTPLNAIIGLVELMMENDLAAGQRQDLEVVNAAAYSLLSVINDILDFSKIEAGKLELEQMAFDIRDFLGESMKIMAPKAHEKGLELVYRISPEVPTGLKGDPTRLRQVLLNLVGNAIKFTDSGEVAVFVTCQEASETGRMLHFSVRDTGIGISKEEQSRIFNAFEQADGSTTRRYGGTGLGLAVSAQLVGLMGGRLRVESQPGQGSAFQFTANFSVTATPDKPLSATQIEDGYLSGRKILVVDDNPTSCQIIAELCQSWQMQVQMAADGISAQQALEEAMKNGAPFESVILDAEMVLPQGNVFFGQMRSAPPLGVVMMRAHGGRGRPWGDPPPWAALETVNKPVRPSDLLQALTTVLGLARPKRRGRPDQDPAERNAFPHPLKILVAEDTRFNQQFMRRLLHRWHHEVTIAGNGLEALKALDKADFDLILMDVQMPGMDGFEATAAIRAREEAAGTVPIPIIAMTAHALKGDRERCLQAGMDDYISKPITARHLMDAMATLVASGKRASPHENPIPDPGPGQDVPLEALLSHFDDDRDFFIDAVDIFLEDYPSVLAEIQTAIEDKDADGLKCHAHSLKGMIDNFQDSQAHAHALALEHMGRNQDLSRGSEALARLKTRLDLLEKSLTGLTRKLRQ